MRVAPLILVARLRVLPVDHRGAAGGIHGARDRYARANWPWVGPLLLWKLNYATIPGIDPGQEMVGWSLLRADWSHRPVYAAVRQLQQAPAPTTRRYEQPDRSGTIRPLSLTRAARTLVVRRQLMAPRASAEKSGGRWYRSTRAGSA